MKRLITLLLILCICLCGCAKDLPLDLPPEALEKNAVPAMAKVGYEARPREIAMPVLMYHHFTDRESSNVDTVVSAKMLDKQMKALKNAGYETVTPYQLCDFANGKGKLPLKPILITIDDGYRSNLEIAAPIFEKYGMNATIFAIGIYEGKEISPHTNKKIDIPRFSFEEAKPWIDKGTIVIQTHTYDMHQKAADNISGREGVLQKEGEQEEEYRQALRADIEKAKNGLETKLGITPVAIAFPYGLNSKIAVEEWENAGIGLTLTTVYGCSTIKEGVPETIRCMKRWNITDQVDEHKLIQRLKEFNEAIK